MFPFPPVEIKKDFLNLYELISKLEGKVDVLSDKVNNLELKIKELEEEKAKIFISPVSSLTPNTKNINEFNTLPPHDLDSYDNMEEIVLS